MTDDQPASALDRKTIFLRALAAIRSLMELISQDATLLALSVLTWNRNWPIDWPGLDKSTVPFSYMLPSVRVAELAVSLAIAAYLVSGWPNLARLKRGAPKFFILSLVGLWLLTILSVSWSVNGALAIAQAGHLAIWILFAAMIACADWPLSRLGAFFLGGLLLQSAVGLIQFVTQHFVGLPEQFGELPVKPEYTWVSVVFDGPRRLMRAYGLSGHPNLLGGPTAISVLLGTGLAVIWPRLWRALAVLAWMFIWTLLLITFSRSAWIATVVGGAVSIVLLGRARLLDQRAIRPLITLAAIGLILTLVFALVFQPFLIGRIDPATQPLETYSMVQRESTVEIARQLIAAQPLTGVGAANFVLAASAWFGYPVDWVHNVLWLITSELGLPGLTLFLLMIGVLMAVGVRRWQLRSITLWQALIGGSLVGLLPILLFDHYLWTDPPGVLLFAFLAGLWLRPAEP